MSARESYFSRLSMDTRIMHRLLLFSLMAFFPILISTAARAQISTGSAQTVPSWVGNLLLQNSTITADPTLTAPEAQGLGQKFELLYSMMNDVDPLNADNDTISLVATPTAIR